MSQPSGSVTGTASPASRTTQEIESEIEATRNDLATNVDLLQRRLSPASLAAAARDRVTAVVKRDDGSLDPVRTAVVAGVVLVVTLYFVRRRRL